jgi:4-amino-4-deoxy-L-arabinose transferase-like glycosyltransferase
MGHSNRYMNAAFFSSLWGVVVLIGAVLLLRLYFLSIWPFGLYADESQYWLWAQNLDWGYYSKPPMVAWAIALTTAIGGSDSVFWVKLASPIAYGVSAWFVFLTLQRLHSPQVGVWAALLFLTIPGVSVSSMLISTDPFLLMFWSMAFWAFMWAKDSGKLRWWLLAGLCAGLAMMSKYSALFFLLSVLLLSGWQAPSWQWLRQKGFWLACLLAFLVFLPNLYWNAEHDWLSFQHTGDITRFEQRQWFHPKELLEFIGAQVGLMGPVLFVGLVMMLWRWHDVRCQEGMQRLLAFVIPLLGVMMLLSFLTRAHGNWAAPIYVTLVPAIALFWWERGQRVWLMAALLSHLLLGALLHYSEPVMTIAGMPLTKKSDPFHRVRGWPELGAQLSTLRKQHPDAGLLTDRRKVSAQLVYHTQPHAFDLVQWNPAGVVKDHYEQTTTMVGKEGQNFLIVTPTERTAHGIASHFSRVKPLPPLVVEILPGKTRQLEVIYGQDYQGIQN